MNDDTARYRGTVTGVATYEAYNMDSFMFQRLIFESMQLSRSITFDAKLLDDPSPRPQVHTITAEINEISWLKNSHTVMLVNLTRDDGTWFQVQIVEDAPVVRFEVIT